jgi:hypothetical protein
VLCRYARFGFGLQAAAGILSGPDMLYDARWCCGRAQFRMLSNKEISCDNMARSLEC